MTSGTSASQLGQVPAKCTAYWSRTTFSQRGPKDLVPSMYYTSNPRILLNRSYVELLTETSAQHSLQN